jgi:hypothetical protein
MCFSLQDNIDVRFTCRSEEECVSLQNNINVCFTCRIEEECVFLYNILQMHALHAEVRKNVSWLDPSKDNIACHM